MCQAYGDWSKAGVLPRDARAVKCILTQYDLPRNANPVIAEEYSRLEKALDYQRRAFCLDMDGLLLENKECLPHIRDAIAQIRKRHACVVTTAAPECEAGELLENTGFGRLAVFGDLGAVNGKNYRPVSAHFGYAWPEKRLVAVSHSLQDTPADVRMPFLCLNVPPESLACALVAGAQALDGKLQREFKIIEHSAYREIRKA